MKKSGPQQRPQAGSQQPTASSEFPSLAPSAGERAGARGALPKPWVDALPAAGFAQTSEGWRRNGFGLTPERSWVQLENLSESPPLGDACSQLGRPGLWKWITGVAGPRLVFELPARTATETVIA